jgi:pyruvate dehydrogenase complex dehydrogenase (E1) component
VNLLGDNIDTTKKNTESWINSTKKVGLEMGVERTKYMLMSRHHNAGQNQYIKVANISFENVLQFTWQ